ncbi:MAG: hypothetical protein ABI778_07750 [Ignavibacteriota bacterium]
MFFGQRWLALLFLIGSSAASAQPVIDQVRDATRELNITVGTPIVNEQTKKVLNVIDRIPGLMQTIKTYNRKFGNDSVFATRYVDRLPDPDAEDTLVKNYYDVVVVSDSAKQTSRWYSFLVRKDLKNVKYYDLKQGKTGESDDWKKLWPASEFLKQHH